MSIKTTQKCDKCKAERELTPSILTSELKTIAQSGGWRTIDNRHLCPECVKGIFGEEVSA